MMQKPLQVAILGKGISGLSAGRLLAKLGAELTFFDEKEQGPLSDDALLGFDQIVLSPGFPRSRACIVNALRKDIPVLNEIDIAAPFLKDCKIIGVTGTNGKSTTTAMIGDILKMRDKGAFVGGNLGRPLCDAICEGETPRYAVLELSSYQLETISKLHLDVALVTQLTPDHIDRYPNAEAYYAAKDHIFALLGSDGVSLINQKDPNSVRYLHPSARSLGYNQPLPFETPNLVGAHNLENAAAAFAATRALGFDVAEIAEALRNFKGLPHRLELLGDIDGVSWFNDSKATNVESAMIAVKSFERGVHLILGGLGKRASYAPLVALCQGRVRRVYTIGDDAATIEAAFAGACEVASAKTLDNAVQLAMKAAQRGDVILLAPACASFDQYPNYMARGDHLRQLFLVAKSKAPLTSS